MCTYMYDEDIQRFHFHNVHYLKKSHSEKEDLLTVVLSHLFFFFFFVKFIPLHFLWPWGFKLNSAKPALALSLIKSALSFPLSLSLTHTLCSTNQWALDVWISAAKYGQPWPPKDTKKKRGRGKKKMRHPLTARCSRFTQLLSYMLKRAVTPLLNPPPPSFHIWKENRVGRDTNTWGKGGENKSQILYIESRWRKI